MLIICECVVFFTSAVFMMGLSSMSKMTSPWDAAIIATTKAGKTKLNKSVLYVTIWVSLSCTTFNTSRRHADFAVDAIWITAKLFQAVDGALTHHRFPAKWSVVDYLQHDGRSVHLLFGEKLDQDNKYYWRLECMIHDKHLFWFE